MALKGLVNSRLSWSGVGTLSVQGFPLILVKRRKQLVTIAKTYLESIIFLSLVVNKTWSCSLDSYYLSTVVMQGQVDYTEPSLLLNLAF